MSHKSDEIIAIERASEWLSRANLLSKHEQPYLEALGPDFLQIAFTAIDFIAEIQRSLPPSTDDNIISISIEDMRVLTALMKLVVVYGIFPLLGEKAMVALSPRVPNWTLPTQVQIASEKEIRSNLRLLSKKTTAIFEKNDDVTSILLVSPFMVDLLALTSHSNESEFQLLMSKLPTFNAYKYLIQLRSAPMVTSLVPKTLSMLVIKRRDAVQTLIDLVLETGDGADVSNLSKCIPALTMLPEGINTKLYIEHLGEQFYAALSKEVPIAESDPILIEAIVIVIIEISVQKPSFLGRLRNLIIAPFTEDIHGKPEVSLSKSANALLRLLRKGGSFAEHLISRTVISIWLLICTSISKTQSVDNFITVLMTTALELSPSTINLLISHLLVDHIPPRLEWSIRDGKEYALVETVNRPTDESLLNQIDRRISALSSVVLQTNDATAASMFIFLMRQWTGPREGSDGFGSAVSKLLTAKAIEHLSSDEQIKKKLFNNPVEIIDLVFSLITSRCRPPPTLNNISGPSAIPDKLVQLDLGDSDDEDEVEDAEGNGGGDENAEDTQILEVALSLLGNVLMEAATEATTYVNDLQKSQLKSIAADTSLSKTIRARADFCYELAAGAPRFQSDDSNIEDDERAKQIAYEALKEPLVPSRAYGIHLIAKLSERGAVTLPEAMAVYEGALADDDSYVYLNAIKAIEGSASTFSAAAVIDALLPLLSNESGGNLDTELRAREALVRLLTPGSMAKASGQLIDLLISDLRASSKETRDIRLRISSASLLGIIIAQFPLSFSSQQENEATDCALGIITHERAVSDVALIRAATVLALEIVHSVNDGNFSDVAKSTYNSLITVVQTVLRETDDHTLKDLAQGVIDSTKISL